MSIFHLKWPHMKHEENSIRGVEEAARRHDDEVDIDLQITKADPECPIDGKDCVGHEVGDHWPRPMIRDGFRDPLKKLKRTRTIASMTWPEVERLRTKPKKGKTPYHISRVETLLDKCAEVGVGARLEPKGDKRFEQVARWERIKKHADKVHAKVHGYSIRNLGGKNAGVRRVAAMKKAGIPSRVIH